MSVRGCRLSWMGTRPLSSALRTLTPRGLGSDNPACRPNATRSVPPLLKMKSTCPEHTVLSGFNLAYSGRFPPKCLTIKLKDVRIHWGNGHVLARAVTPTGPRARLMVNGLVLRHRFRILRPEAVSQRPGRRQRCLFLGLHATVLPHSVTSRRARLTNADSPLTTCPECCSLLLPLER